MKDILFGVAIMVLGAQSVKPLGWAAIVFAFLALLVGWHFIG